MSRKLKCSFCGKSAAEVQRLIAGPSVFICDGCVAACNRVLDTHPPADPAPIGAIPQPRRRWPWRVLRYSASPQPARN